MAHIRTDLDDDALDFFSFLLLGDWFLFDIVDVFFIID